MSLRDELNEGIAELWDELDDVPTDAVLKEVTLGAYTPDTGREKVIEDHEVSIVLESLTEREAAELCGGLGDYSIMLPLSTVSYMPKVGDYYDIGGENYYINLTDTDPARVLHTSFCSTGAPISNVLK